MYEIEMLPLSFAEFCRAYHLEELLQSIDLYGGSEKEDYVALTELYRLYKSNQLKGDKPCCSVYGNYELDFMLVAKDDKRYGIEVKATRSDKHESLDYFMNNKFIDEAYVAEIIRGGVGRNVRTIPIYTVGCRFPYH